MYGGESGLGKRLWSSTLEGVWEEAIEYLARQPADAGLLMKRRVVFEGEESLSDLQRATKGTREGSPRVAASLTTLQRLKCRWAGCNLDDGTEACASMWRAWVRGAH